jgi:hypothetical protein
LRAGQVLGEARLISAAADRGRWIATLPHGLPDLYHGTAGRVRFHLFLRIGPAKQPGGVYHFLVALAAVPDLLLCAKHLFVAAKDWGIDGISIGNVVSPLWTGVILVAANPRRAMLPP